MLPPVNALASLPGPISPLAIASRVAGQGERVSAVEPGQDPRARTSGDTVDDRRRVPPPPRSEASPAERSLRGDQPEAADPRLSRPGSATERGNPFQNQSEAFRRPVFTPAPGVFDAATERAEVGRQRPRPSPGFLAQAIGQEIAGRFGPVGLNTDGVSRLYRQTEAVTELERLRATGDLIAPPPTSQS